MAAGVPVEVEERLAEGELIARVLELLPTAGDGPLLCCTHSDVIESLLRVLELAEPDKSGRIPCKKGSVWVLEGGGYTPTRATYFEPVGRPKRGRAVRYSAGEEFERSSLALAYLRMWKGPRMTRERVENRFAGKIVP